MTKDEYLWCSLESSNGGETPAMRIYDSKKELYASIFFFHKIKMSQDLEHTSSFQYPE